MAVKEAKDIEAESASCFPSSAESKLGDSLKETPQTENGLKAYWQMKNLTSIDGLPGLHTAFKSTTTFDPATASKDWGKDDESISTVAQVKGNSRRFDPNLLIGFILGLCVAGLSFKMGSLVAYPVGRLKIRNYLTTMAYTAHYSR